MGFWRLFSFNLRFENLMLNVVVKGGWLLNSVASMLSLCLGRFVCFLFSLFLVWSCQVMAIIFYGFGFVLNTSKTMHYQVANKSIYEENDRYYCYHDQRYGFVVFFFTCLHLPWVSKTYFKYPHGTAREMRLRLVFFYLF